MAEVNIIAGAIGLHDGLPAELPALVVVNGVNIIPPRMAVRPYFVDPNNPTEAEIDVIGNTIFHWCRRVLVSNMNTSTCPCDLCFFLRMNGCSPKLIQMFGVVHNLEDMHDDCAICNDISYRIHVFNSVNCECDFCVDYNDGYYH
jgi:hypothetical protein